MRTTEPSSVRQQLIDLAALLRQLRAAVRETTDRVDATLSRIERWPAERKIDQARIREETRRWAEEHPEEVEALAVLFRGG